MPEFDLTIDQTETIADVLEYAESEAVTAQERDRIQEVKEEFVSQWANAE